MPEVDLSRHRPLTRGKHAARAQRSLAVLALDRKMVETLGGPDAVALILRALADAVGPKAETKAKKRSAA